MMSSFRPRLLSSCSQILRSASTLVDAKEQTYATKLTFRPAENKPPLAVDIIYQDTLPSGKSPLGTVVALHGSPGSHRDFKFVAPFLNDEGIRVIGMNWPGFGYSEDHPELMHSNVERTALLQAFIDELGLRSDILFMGHSRGCDNTLEIAVKNPERTLGVVLLTPFALRDWLLGGIGRVRALVSLYHAAPRLRPALHRFFYRGYKIVGLPARTGRIAANCMRTKATTFYAGQKKFIDALNADGTIPVLMMYGGKDPLIPPKDAAVHAEQYRDRLHLECRTNDPSEEEKLAEEMKKAFAAGRPAVTVAFQTDNHYVQKHRAKFVADGVIAILRSRQNKTTEPDA